MCTLAFKREHNITPGQTGYFAVCVSCVSLLRVSRTRAKPLSTLSIKTPDQRYAPSFRDLHHSRAAFFYINLQNGCTGCTDGDLLHLTRGNAVHPPTREDARKEMATYENPL